MTSRLNWGPLALRQRSLQKGFSLIEMAIALVVIVLLIGSLLVPLATQVDERRIGETQRTLEEIKEALIGYAARNSASSDSKPYLPCPDTDGNGTEESRTGGVCPSQEGRIPWTTLGVGARDAWGNRFRYRVHANYSNGVNGFFLGSALPDLRVCSAATLEASTCASTIANNIPAAILSHGKNGFRARNEQNVLLPTPSSADEIENIDGRNAGDTVDAADRTFVSRTRTPLDSSAGEFDDVGDWLSANVLLSRMVSAGRLP